MGVGRAMAIASTDDTTLQLALHAAAIGDMGTSWTDALDALARRLRASCIVLAVDDGAELTCLNCGAHAALLTPQHRHLQSGLRALRFDRVYAGLELDAALRAALGAGRDVSIRLLQVALAPGQGRAALIAAREGEASFRAADSACLSMLAPHLAQAASSWLRLCAERRRARLWSGIARAFGAGWLLLDAQARVLDHDAQAARILESRPTPGPLQCGSRLKLPHPATERMLSQALAMRRAAPTERYDIVRLVDGPPLDLLLGPVPVALEQDCPGSAVALGLLRGDNDQAPSPHLLARALGISPSEARLALALAQGMSLAEAATALGLTIETARSYTRRIYARTGLGGQGALVAAVLGSVAWMRATWDVCSTGGPA